MHTGKRMNNKKLCGLVVGVVAILAGCASPAPVAQNFPISYQKVARAAQHWDVVADDVVSQTLDVIATKPQLQGRGIYVLPGRNSAFNTAFREFLITRFVGRGADVSVCKTAPANKPGFILDNRDVEIQYETQVVGHGERLPFYRPGVLTSLAAGVAVLRHVDDWTVGKQNSVSIGLAALADFELGHLAAPTSTEIIITTTIAENNRFIMRRSDVYYVPERDATLYMARGARTSHCPGSKVAAVEEVPTEGEAELARQRMIDDAMRRSNPHWRGAAYSYW
jgi:hypothetical protein